MPSVQEIATKPMTVPVGLYGPVKLSGFDLSFKAEGDPLCNFCRVSGSQTFNSLLLHTHIIKGFTFILGLVALITCIPTVSTYR